METLIFGHHIPGGYVGVVVVDMLYDLHFSLRGVPRVCTANYVNGWFGCWHRRSFPAYEKLLMLLVGGGVGKGDNWWSDRG